MGKNVRKQPKKRERNPDEIRERKIKVCVRCGNSKRKIRRNGLCTNCS